MRTKTKWIVETVDHETSRVPVYGGWLVRTHTTKGVVISSCFVPDPYQKWIIESNEKPKPVVEPVSEFSEV